MNPFVAAIKLAERQEERALKAKQSGRKRRRIVPNRPPIKWSEARETLDAIDDALGGIWKNSKDQDDREEWKKQRDDFQALLIKLHSDIWYRLPEEFI